MGLKVLSRNPVRSMRYHMSQKTYTLSEAARRADLMPGTLRQLIHRGLLPGLGQREENGRWTFWEGDVLRLFIIQWSEWTGLELLNRFYVANEVAPNLDHRETTVFAVLRHGSKFTPIVPDLLDARAIPEGWFVINHAAVRAAWEAVLDD